MKLLKAEGLPTLPISKACGREWFLRNAKASLSFRQRYEQINISGNRYSNSIVLVLFVQTAGIGGFRLFERTPRKSKTDCYGRVFSITFPCPQVLNLALYHDYLDILR